MTLTDDLKISLLLILYLCRSGRADIYDVASELSLSTLDIGFIADRLAVAGILMSTGVSTFEVIGDPTLIQVLRALGAPSTLTLEEVTKYKVGRIEERALLSLAASINSAVGIIFNRTIRSIGKERVANETAALNRTGPSTASN